MSQESQGQGEQAQAPGEQTQQTQGPEVPTRVECPATKDPAVRLFIVAAMAIGFGMWCFTEAYILGKYPWEKATGLNEKITYYFNHVGGIALPAIGLIPLIWGIVFLRRKLIADEEGIGYLGKDKIAWSAARGLDASKFADKGILRLKYASDGQERTLVLDRWKLRNFQQLVALVEAKVPPAQAQQ